MTHQLYQGASYVGPVQGGNKQSHPENWYADRLCGVALNLLMVCMGLLYIGEGAGVKVRSGGAVGAVSA
jgi:hypothetical protein